MAPFVPPLTPYLKKTLSNFTNSCKLTSLNPCPYETLRQISGAYWFLNVSTDNCFILWVVMTNQLAYFTYCKNNLVEK